MGSRSTGSENPVSPWYKAHTTCAHRPVTVFLNAPPLRGHKAQDTSLSAEVDCWQRRHSHPPLPEDEEGIEELSEDSGARRASAPAAPARAPVACMLAFAFIASAWRRFCRSSSSRSVTP